MNEIIDIAMQVLPYPAAGAFGFAVWKLYMANKEIKKANADAAKTRNAVLKASARVDDLRAMLDVYAIDPRGYKAYPPEAVEQCDDCIDSVDDFLTDAGLSAFPVKYKQVW